MYHVEILDSSIEVQGNIFFDANQFLFWYLWGYFFWCVFIFFWSFTLRLAVFRWGWACLRKEVCNERLAVFSRVWPRLRKQVCYERLAMFRRSCACLRTEGLQRLHRIYLLLTECANHRTPTAPSTRAHSTAAARCLCLCQVLIPQMNVAMHILWCLPIFILPLSHVIHPSCVYPTTYNQLRLRLPVPEKRRISCWSTEWQDTYMAFLTSVRGKWR